MARVDSTARTDVRALTGSGARIHTIGRLIVTTSILLLCGGCVPSPEADESRADSDTKGSPSPPAGPTTTPTTSANSAPESLSFAEGASLDPLTAVGWNLAILPAGGAWTLDPANEEGETSLVNAEGTCTADHWADNVETSGDDRAASDEFLGQLSGATPDDLDEWAFDGHFALTNTTDGEPAAGSVANRILLWNNDKGSFLLAARVFTNVDYKTSGMANAYALGVRCDAGLDPTTVIDSLDEIVKITVGAQ